jgi:nitrogen fixation/metabolism regulation signal transduction histidine kinase
MKQAPRSEVTCLLKGAFGLVSTIAVALSMAAGVLVTASLFIAERAPQGTTFLWIHMIVSGVFLVLGLLLAGIGREVLGVVRTAAAASDPWAAALQKRLARLLILLTVAGLGLSGILALLTYGILARIDEGFAVFG